MSKVLLPARTSQACCPYGGAPGFRGRAGTETVTRLAPISVFTS